MLRIAKEVKMLYYNKTTHGMHIIGSCEGTDKQMIMVVSDYAHKY